MRESKKRGELVEEIKNALTRNAEKKGQLVQSDGLWIQRREEARRAQNALREADNAFKKEFEKCTASEAGAVRTRRSGRASLASQSTWLQDCRLLGRRPDVHLTGMDELRVGEGKRRINDDTAGVT